jgi:hypothetical protein
MLLITSVFGLGVLIQAFLMLLSVTDLKSGLISQASAFGMSLIAFIPFKHESTYDFSLHYTLCIFLFMVIFSAINNKKILPVITEHSLILFNMVFLYYFFTQLFMPLLLSQYTVLGLIIFSAFFIVPSFAVFLNGLIPMRPPNWVKTFFYVWYLVMASVLLLFVIVPVSQDLNMAPQLDYEYWLPMLSLGMLSMCLSVDVVNVLLLVPYPARDQTFRERLQNVKLHIMLLNSKYKDEVLNPVHTLILMLMISFIFILNIYFLHFSDLVVVNAVFLVGRYLTGYQSSPKINF